MVYLNSIAAPQIELPDSVVRALPNYRLSCPVTGTPPIHTALIRNSAVLANTTGVIEAIIEEGNYTCQATSEYGVDMKDFSVIFVGEVSFKQNIHCSLSVLNTKESKKHELKAVRSSFR